MRICLIMIASGLLLGGAGCTNPLGANEKAATEIMMSAETVIMLEETTAGIDNPFTQEDTTEVVVTTWSAPSVGLRWRRTEQRETQASQDARAAALSSPVGSGVSVPEVQHEEVVIEGALVADGLVRGTHLEVPAVWQEGEVHREGEGNGLLWLSREQYDALVNTRHATVTLGKLDAFLATIIDFSQSASSVLNKVQGNEISASDGADIAALTTLTADPEWGSYEVIYADEKVSVQTIVAENAFARFEILAHAENPLVLSVTPRPTSWVAMALETLQIDGALEGYKITQILPSSAYQPQPVTQ